MFENIHSRPPKGHMGSLSSDQVRCGSHSLLSLHPRPTWKGEVPQPTAILQGPEAHSSSCKEHREGERFLKLQGDLTEYRLWAPRGRQTARQGPFAPVCSLPSIVSPSLSHSFSLLPSLPPFVPKSALKRVTPVGLVV